MQISTGSTQKTGGGGVQRLDDWAATWQCGQWSCADLAEAMSAGLTVLPGGPNILGISHRGDWTIGINSRLVDTPLFTPVLLHEAGHLLTAPRPVSTCRADWRPVAGEQLAWMGAGRLSLSAEQGAAIDRGQASAQEIADDNGTPPALVAVGQAVLHRLHLPRSLVPPAELGTALAHWMLAMHNVVKLL